MENMFIWMLVVSGALVALLAVFLAAAERELKNKRAEVEQLLAKLETQTADPASASAESSESVAGQVSAAAPDQNQRLQEEIDRLSGELEVSRKANERLEAARLEDKSASASAERLTVTNQQLQAEVAELRERLRVSEARSAAPSGSVAAASEREAQLQSQIAELQKKLEAARLEDKSASASAERLTVTTQQLQAEVADLRERLRVSESRSAASSEGAAAASEHEARLQSQIAELQKKLEVGAAKIEELKTAEQKAASVKALEAFQADEEKRFESKITDLEKQLAAERETVAASASLQERLAQSERDNQSLKIERRQQDEEMSLWQARIDAAEAQQRRMSSLQAHYDSVLSEHASLAEQQNRFQDQLTTFARLLSARVDTAEPSAGPAVSKVHRLAAPTPMAAENRSAETAPAAAMTVTPAVLDRDQLDSQSIISAPERVATAVQLNKKRKHRFGLSPLMIGVAIASTVAFASWYRSSDKAEVPTVTASIPPVPAPAAKVERQAEPVENAAVIDAAAEPTPNESEPVQVAVKPKEPARAPAKKESAELAKTTPSAKSETRVAGTYEITRPSRVYAAPSELSQLIGDVEPGVKVNVVNAHDGWLEIHSKYNRPPGYVRKEAAARVGGQN